VQRRLIALKCVLALLADFEIRYIVEFDWWGRLGAAGAIDSKL